jgi:hypothetical protein
VEDEWRAYREGRVGHAPAPPQETSAAAERLRLAQALLEGSAAALLLLSGDALETARRALAEAGAGPTLASVDSAIDAADAALLRGWLGGLSRAERAAIGLRCRMRAGRRPFSTRASAYRAALRAHLIDAAREGGLLCLRGTV